MKIDMKLSNFYGSVTAYEKNGKYYISLGDWSGLDIHEVSEEFYRSIEKEFGEPQE